MQNRIGAACCTCATAFFGDGFAHAHPELTAAVMLSASLDFHDATLAHAVRDVAGALLIEEGVGPAVELVRPPAILR
jgi:hypothetical protein